MEDINAQIASVSAECAEAKRKVTEAERDGKPLNYQMALINNETSSNNMLTELLKERNILVNAQTQGKAPTALFPCNYLILCSFCCVLQLLLRFKVY
jgi:hypothetical protein